MTAIVLAGGSGSRMKADKAGLDVGGRTLLELVVAQLEPYFEEVLVSISPGQNVKRPGTGDRPGRDEGKSDGRKDASLKFIEDELPGNGPLGGILSGLKAAANDACAVIACDIPDIDAPLLRSLAEAAARAEIAVPLDPEGRYEPLFAIYKKSLIPEIETLLRSGERSILPLFERCPTAVLRLDKDRRLRNLNTRADYLNYLKSHQRK